MNPSTARRLTALALLVAAVILAPETAAMHPAEPTPKRWQPPGLFITVYDWGLGGINCDDDCSTTALTTTGDDILGWTAACPSAWLGHVTTTVVTMWGESYWCVDSFGAPEHRVLTEVDGRDVYRIDIAHLPAAEHPWNQEYVPYSYWSREWRPMAEFYPLRETAAIQMETP